MVRLRSLLLAASLAGLSAPAAGAAPAREARDPGDGSSAGAAAASPRTDRVAPAAPVAEPSVAPFEMLGRRVDPGQMHKMLLVTSESFAGDSLEAPVFVAHGTQAGPTLCVTAGIHGDELNGIEVVRRVVERTDPRLLAGTVVAVPIVNLHGFRRTSRYLPDRRDLNRFFPGRVDGSSASRIASALFERVVLECDALVDLHTGSFHRTNLPQIRADLTRHGTAELAVGFGAAVVVHHVGTPGTLRRAATDAGIPAITYEAGEPMRFLEWEVEEGVRGIRSLQRWLDMAREPAAPPTPRPRVYHQSRWARADKGGILFSRVSLGDDVAAGQLLGVVTDPITNARSEIVAPSHGRVIGMAVNQVVIPGFAAFHLGVEGAAFRVLRDGSDSEEMDGHDLPIDEDPEGSPE